ncbi:hypothetical protein EXIGLDRAFT_578608, partial [Exidia glandulosa HHB12029]
ELIQALVKAYEGTNVGAQTFYAFQRLLRARYEDGTSMTDHIASIRALLRQLSVLKSPVDAQLSAFILLESMPETPRWELLTASAMRNSDETAAAASTTHKANKPNKTVGKATGKWCVVHKAKSHSTEECKKVLALSK